MIYNFRYALNYNFRTLLCKYWMERIITNKQNINIKKIVKRLAPQVDTLLFLFTQKVKK